MQTMDLAHGAISVQPSATIAATDQRPTMDEAPGEATGRASYLSYLLRLWREGEVTEGWRASLHDPHTGERLGFAGLDELFGFLREQAGAPADASETSRRPDPADRDRTTERPN